MDQISMCMQRIQPKRIINKYIDIKYRIILREHFVHKNRIRMKRWYVLLVRSNETEMKINFMCKEGNT